MKVVISAPRYPETNIENTNTCGFQSAGHQCFRQTKTVFIYGTVSIETVYFAPRCVFHIIATRRLLEDAGAKYIEVSR